MWIKVAGFSLLIVGVYTMVRLTSLGAFSKIEDAADLPVKVVAEIPGPEDLELNRNNGMLYFISSNPCSENPGSGGIYYIDLNQDTRQAVAFQFEKPQDFHPHGLSYLHHGDSQYLFTNNHRSDGAHSVEIFRIIKNNQLEHLESVTDPLLTSPNDLVAIGPRSFYVTNDGRAHDRFTRSVDTFLGRKTGKVLFFDGQQFITVVDNLDFPNGIALDTKNKQLFVAETLSGYINTYQMADKNLLRLVDSYFTGVGIDNINITPNGLLVAAIHPNLLALSKHMKGSPKPSPSRVVQIDLISGVQSTLYQHNGGAISGISSAIPYRGLLYLGAVCDPALMELEIKDYRCWAACSLNEIIQWMPNLSVHMPK
jgi:arylesterase/paraoxonase